MSKPRCTEVVIFKTLPGISKEAFQHAVQETQETFLRKVPGFISRELTQGEGDLWIDIVHWSTPESANLAFDQWMDQASCRKMGEMIDPKSIQHLTTTSVSCWEGTGTPERTSP